MNTKYVKCSHIKYNPEHNLKYLMNIEDKFIGVKVLYRPNSMDIKLELENDTFINYTLKYSRMMKNVMNDLGIGFQQEGGLAFVHYTVTNSKKALDSRFTLRNYSFYEGNLVPIEQWNFKERYVVPLPNMGVSLAKRFLQLYMIKSMYNDNEMLEQFKITKEGYNIDDIISKQLKPKKTKNIEAVDNTTINIKTQGTKMNAIDKTKAITTQAVEINKEAMKLAAKLEVGSIATKQIKDKIKLPFGTNNKIKNHPLFDIALANVVGVALREVAPGNEKAQILSEAMIQSAAVEMVQSFNVNDMVNDLLKNIDLSKITNLD